MVSIPFWVNRIREMYVGMALPPRCLGGCALAADTCAGWHLGRLRVRNSQGKTRSPKPGMRDSRAGTGDTACRSLPAIGTDERRRSGGPTVAPAARKVKQGHIHGPSCLDAAVTGTFWEKGRGLKLLCSLLLAALSYGMLKSPAARTIALVLTGWRASGCRTAWTIPSRQSGLWQARPDHGMASTSSTESGTTDSGWPAPR